MSNFLKTPAGWIVFLLSALLVIGAFFVSDGLFTVDELIYMMGVDAYSDRSSFVVQNGFEQYGSNDLRVWFLKDGPNGLSPQYPPGTAILGGALYGIFGMRSLIILNALAAAGSLIVTYMLARDMTGSAKVALIAVLFLFFGTFFVEYAFGIWPHAINTFFVVIALWLAIRATATDTDTSRFAMASGLAVGAGILFRADAVLVLSIIGAFVVLYSSKPIQTILLGTVGLVPAMVLAAAINKAKFGTYNPLSYGGGASVGGGDDPSSHFAAIILVTALLGSLMIARNLTWNARYKIPTIATIIALPVVGYFLPPTRQLFTDYALGAYTLFIDMTAIRELAPGVIKFDSGIVSFWGVAKKALGQSMPWLGAFTLLFVIPWRSEFRKVYILGILSIGLWTLPFVLREWHGGFSSNMRYFLPILPVVAVMAATLWVQVSEMAPTPPYMPVVGIISGIVIVILWAVNTPTAFAGVNQSLSTYLLFAMAALGLLPVLPWPDKQLSLRLVQFGFAATVGIAMFLSLYVDVTVGQNRRLQIKGAGEVFASLPGPSIFYGNLEIFPFQLDREDSFLAAPNRLSRVIDTALIEAALADGFHIYMLDGTLEKLNAQTNQFDSKTLTINEHVINEIVAKSP